MSPFPAPPAPLTDGTIRLRPSAERDIPEILIAYEDDRHLHERLGERRPPSGADLGRASEQAQDDWAAGRRAAFSVTPEGSDTCVGQVILAGLGDERRRAQAIVWLAPGARGRGWGMAALRLATAWALGDGGVDRVEAEVPVEATGLLRLAQAAGLRRENARDAGEARLVAERT